MSNLAIVDEGKPAQEIGLAVGYVDRFTETLFSPRPYEHSDPSGFDNWKSKTTALATPEAVERFRERITAIVEIEPEANGPLSRQLGDLLRPIGAKIAPQLSGEQATAWRKAMVMALADLPPDVAMLAAKEALHEPMKFLSDVEMTIRKLAKASIKKLNRAVDNFERIRTDDVPRIFLVRDRVPPEPDERMW